LQYLQARNQYFHEIKLAKQSSWNDFLENADSEQIFKAYKYCKQRKIEKIPIIQYNNKKLTTFTKKSEAFLTALLPASLANIAASADFANNCTNYMNFTNSLNSHSASHSNIDENQWNWPELTIEKLEKVIFSSSIKKAAGSDRIDFLIIQKAYSTIPELFFQLYYKLIKLGFHPTCWKELIDVVIKKLNKDDYSDSKSYRIISLLNYLDKISEKIIAERLLFFAKNH